MPKFNFNLREPNSTKETAIHLVIRWDNNQLVYPTRLNIAPVFWETDKTKSNFQRAITSKKFPEYPEFNLRLDKIEQDAKTVFNRFLNENDHIPPSLEELRELLNIKFNKIKGKTKRTLFDFFALFIQESKVRQNLKTGVLISPNTMKAYNKCLALLKEYKVEKNIRVDFDTMDLEFFYSFLEFLFKKEYSKNTIQKYVKTLKSILNSATERGLNKNLAFKNKNWSVSGESSDSIYLNEKELIEIYNLDLSNDYKLDKVRDVFLIGCWTSLRYIDLSVFSKESITNNMIRVKAQKTQRNVVIPIHPTVSAIIEKYKGKNENEFPKVLSNQKMNEYLKEIGKKIPALNDMFIKKITKGGKTITIEKERWKLITTHTARRSFATNLYISGKVDTKDIMNITGHTTEESFFKYIRVTRDESAKKIDKLWQKEQKLNTVKKKVLKTKQLK